MNILKGKEELARARRELREGFMAKSSRASQRTKREQVMAMAREACSRAGLPFGHRGERGGRDQGSGLDFGGPVCQ